LRGRAEVASQPHKLEVGGSIPSCATNFQAELRARLFLFRGATMTNVEIKRDHKGVLHMHVNGVPALHVEISTISNLDGEPCFVAYVPLDKVTIGELHNVVPFRQLKE
jgi:hypothetical protein